MRPVAASKQYRLGNVPETAQESLEPYSCVRISLAVAFIHWSR